jgi:hypothetical protein
VGISSLLGRSCEGVWVVHYGIAREPFRAQWDVVKNYFSRSMMNNPPFRIDRLRLISACQDSRLRNVPGDRI